MSYYNQWFNNSQNCGDGGKRKRDDFYSDGGKYSSDYIDNSSASTGGLSGRRGMGRFGQGTSGFGQRTGGFGTGTGRFGTGAGRFGRGAGRFGGSGFGGESKGDFDFTTNIGYSSSFVGKDPAYDTFLDGNITNPKKKRIAEMREEILQLEDDTEELKLEERLMRLREEKRLREMRKRSTNFIDSGPSFSNFGRDEPGPFSGPPSLLGPRGGFGYGRGRGVPVPFARGGRLGGGPRFDEAYDEKQGRGKGRGHRSREGGRSKRKKKQKKEEESKSQERPREEDNPYEFKLERRVEFDVEGRDERLKKLMIKLKTFNDRDNPPQTLGHCIRNNNIEIFQYFDKKSVLFLDGLFIAQGEQPDARNNAYKEAIRKLKTMTLEEIKADAEKAGDIAVYPDRGYYPAHTVEESKLIMATIEIAEFPFKKRLELFRSAIKRHEHSMVCLRYYCIKYAMNMKFVDMLPNEESVNKHETRIYLCDMLVSSAQHPERNRSYHLALMNFNEALRNKTVEELLENDGKFDKENYLDTPIFIRYRGVGHQVENNLWALDSYGKDTLEQMKKNTLDDLVIIEKKSMEGSWIKILEESANYSRLKLEFIYDLEHPGEPLPEIGKERKLNFRVDRIRDGKRGRRKNVHAHEHCDFQADKVYSDMSSKEAIETHKNAVAERAREFRVMMIHCKILLQGELVGEGYGTYRTAAKHVAAIVAYQKLFPTHSAIFHHDDGKNEKQDLQFSVVREKAEKLRTEMPEPPFFEKPAKTTETQTEDDDDDDVDYEEDDGPEEEENDDKGHDEGFEHESEDENADDNQNEEAEMEMAENGEGCTIKTSRKSLKKKPDELAPWIKEVVRSDLENYSKTGVLWEGFIIYRNYPKYMYNYFKHFADMYGLKMKPRTERGIKNGVMFTKIPPLGVDMVDSLMGNSVKCYNRYTLEQKRMSSGNVEVFNKMVKKSVKKLPKAKPT